MLTIIGKVKSGLLKNGKDLPEMECLRIAYNVDILVKVICSVPVQSRCKIS
jgi:hypothetical protein